MMDGEFETLLKDDVIERLKAIGYDVTEEDMLSVMFAIEKTVNHIQNYCNIDEIPEGLHHVTVDMACGEFLYIHKQMGTLGEAFDVETAVKQVKVGDTSVSYGTEDVDQIGKLIDMLKYGHEGDLLCYRRLRW